MIVDQLDSTHLSSSLPNLPTDQLSTQYLTPLSSTGVLDKSHSFIPSLTFASLVDSSIHPLFFDAPSVAIHRPPPQPVPLLPTIFLSLLHVRNNVSVSTSQLFNKFELPTEGYDFSSDHNFSFPTSTGGLSQYELLSSLTILHNNINGLRYNPTKLTQLAEFAFDSNAYLIGVTETNIDDKAGKFIPFNDHYKAYFSDYDGKIKEATFYFKGCTIHIGVVYIEPNNKANTTRITKLIKDKIFNYNRWEEPYIILGDFNTLRNKRLDHSRQKGHIGPANNLFISFDEFDYIDSFRELHPNSKTYSYAHDSIQTRIDYIWLSPAFTNTLLKADLLPSLDVTDSDHKINTISINFGFHISFNLHNFHSKCSKEKHKVYQYDKATKEQWSSYQTQVAATLRSNRTINLIDSSSPPSFD
ncbi:Endonuclease/exonuclease/phosphatase [Glomus cerebriforme]|uniref:Endonuclease/exonuclease/phosphatase n=1 Tax=Glomus cerebriforme TaxID=658196 RepID=A0A397T9Z6_9GLOM|nr:Endonuclease/exonuclease/phosphatase [Glomus cerebriforme]